MHADAQAPASLDQQLSQLSQGLKPGDFDYVSSSMPKRAKHDDDRIAAGKLWA